MAFVSEDEVRLTGRFDLRQKDEIVAEIWYIPSAEELESMSSYLVDEEEPVKQIRYARFDTKADALTLWPIMTFAKYPSFLRPKYKKIRMISVIGLGLDLPNTLEEFTECLQQLPTGFLRNWHSGLGVHKAL